MTMHLQRGLSTIRTSKRKRKLTVGKMKELHMEWQEHNRDLRRSGRPKITFEEYMDWVFGRVKVRNPKQREGFVEFKPTTSFTQERASEVHKYPSAGAVSRNDSGMRRKESPKYTGTLIKGIATLHKSNAVPVIDQKYAEEISRMAK